MTKLDANLTRLHSANDDALQWLAILQVNPHTKEELPTHTVQLTLKVVLSTNHLTDTAKTKPYRKTQLKTTWQTKTMKHNNHNKQTWLYHHLVTVNKCGGIILPIPSTTREKNEPELLLLMKKLKHIWPCAFKN